MKVLLVFTYGYSLKTWEKSGTLAKELELYNKLSSKYGIKFIFLTYGDKTDIEINLNNEDIKVVPIYSFIKKYENKLLNYIYSFFIPFKVYKKFKEIENTEGEKIITDGGKVVFFSLEMSSEQLATRILAEQSKISGDKMRKAELSKDDFKNIANISSKLESLNLIIDDNPILTIPSLRARARRLKRLHDINLIIIDYLQLMSGSPNRKNDGRVQEISEITRGLKAIAKELNIPIIALSQLSRQVEQREDKRPQLADLRESGTIEQDSDVVMFIFRESYYLERMEPIKKPEESEDKYDERHNRWRDLCEKAHNTAEIIIAKQRHGPIGSLQLHFNAKFTKFSNLTDEKYQPKNTS